MKTYAVAWAALACALAVTGVAELFGWGDGRSLAMTHLGWAVTAAVVSRLYIRFEEGK